MIYIEETNKKLDKENKCPICHSDRISIYKVVEIYVKENLKTSKILKKDRFGATKTWCYKCRKCGWLSMVYSE